MMLAWFGKKLRRGSAERRRAGTLGATHVRRLRFEQLENRAMLSASAGVVDATLVDDGAAHAAATGVSDTIGLYNPAASQFLLRGSNTTGTADRMFAFGPNASRWTPLVGDWTGSGVTTVGLYDSATSTFYLRNSNTTGVANTVFGFGQGGAGWLPVVGDWDGNGTDTVGLYDPSTSTFYLRNSNTAGLANLTFGFGAPRAGWLPLAGDWNGGTSDTVALYDPSTSLFYQRFSNTGGVANNTFGYGPAGRGWIPVAGNWTGTTMTSVGLFDRSGATFYLRNSNSSGVADATFGFGAPGANWTPLAGHWTASTTTPAPTPTPTPSSGAFQIDVTLSGLTAGQQQIVEQAVDRWETIIVGDLPNVTSQGQVIDDLAIDISGVAIDGVGGILGQASATAYRTGSDLPYLGFIEFDTADVASMQADGSLLGVLEHEIGHVLGFGVIWSDLGLLSGTTTNNPRFTGANATAEYNRLFGTSAGSVPVESGGGAGTRLSHWSEAVFGNELMTGWYNSGQSNPLSRITVASMADLGYQVNLAAADPYTPPAAVAAGTPSIRSIAAAALRSDRDSESLSQRNAQSPARTVAADLALTGMTWRGDDQRYGSVVSNATPPVLGSAPSRGVALGVSQQVPLDREPETEPGTGEPPSGLGPVVSSLPASRWTDHPFYDRGQNAAYRRSVDVLLASESVA
jgi:hypothetical protein